MVNPPSLMEAFDTQAEAWETYTQTPPGRLREQLTGDYLVPHLPPPPARLLDIGAGTGGLALTLAQSGYTVHLLDISERMLAIARRKAQARDLEQQVHFHCADVTQWPAPVLFDGLICHTLLEYVAAWPELLTRCLTWLAPRGIFSLVYVNQYAEPLSLALGKGQLDAARAALDQPSAAADLFGVPRQLFTREVVQRMITPLPLELVAEYGVRIVADYTRHSAWKEDLTAFAELLRLEAALAPRFPYNQIGRYGQLVYRKTG